MDAKAQELQLSIANARAQQRAHDQDFGQGRWMDVLQKLESMGREDAKRNFERDMSRFEIDTRAYREAFQDQRGMIKQEIALHVDDARKKVDPEMGRQLQGQEAQAGQRYSGEVIQSSRDYLVTLNREDNMVTLHDRSRLSNQAEWAKEGKQVEVNYSPGGIGTVQERDRNPMEHQGRDLTRDHSSSNDHQADRGLDRAR